MQANSVIATINWIRSALSENVQENILTNRLLRASEKDSASHLEILLAATHDWTRDVMVVKANPFAVTVIAAFGGSAFLLDEAPAQFAKKVLADRDSRMETLHTHVSRIVEPFRIMFLSVGPWEKLVIPELLREEGASERFLAITVESLELTKSRTLQEVLEHLQNLYAVFAKLSGVNPEDLEIVNIQSGSSININFKGSGELIKELRLLINDMWNIIRFRSQHEQLVNNMVLMSNLTVIKEIGKRVSAHSLSPEEGEKMRREIARNTAGLFNSHAITTERVGVESVDNSKLLESLNPRLLPSESENSTPGSATTYSSKVSGRKGPSKKAGHKKQF